jgi:hypothetical protein
MNDTAFEPHYSITDLAQQWHRGVETVRGWVKDEPGVLVVRGPKGKGCYSIPESVARRIHTKRINRAK